MHICVSVPSPVLAMGVMEVSLPYNNLSLLQIFAFNVNQPALPSPSEQWPTTSSISIF